MAKKLLFALITHYAAELLYCVIVSQTPLYLFESSAESLKHSLHVASFLHGDDPGVVLLIDPDQEGLLIVVPEEKQVKELNKELSR